MEHLLTTNQALLLIAVSLIMLYFIATAKSTTPTAKIESDREPLEEQGSNYTTPAYLERYGAYIQSQGKYYN